MQPAHTLADVRQAMTWRELPGRFGLIGFSGPPTGADLALIAGGAPAQIVREPERTTLLLAEEHVGAVTRGHPGAEVQAGLTWIRFEAAMAWDLVGFLALLSSELARAGVPLGVVCSYWHDHLFVAEAHLEVTRTVLADLFGSPAGRPEAAAGDAGVR